MWLAGLPGQIRPDRSGRGTQVTVQGFLDHEGFLWPRPSKPQLLLLHDLGRGRVRHRGQNGTR